MRDRLGLVLKRITDSTGPKISSRAIFMSLRDAVEHGRLDVVAAAASRARAPPATSARAFAAAGVDVAQHGAQLRRRRRSRPSRCAGVERIGRLVLAAPRRRRCATNSSAMRSCTNTRDGALQLSPWLKNMLPATVFAARVDVVEVVEDDEGRLAAELVVDALQVAAAGVLEHPAADARGAGEADRVDVHVQRQRLAGFVRRSPARR